MTIAKNIEWCPDSLDADSWTVDDLQVGQIWDLKYEGKFSMCLLLNRYNRGSKYNDWRCLNLDTSITFYASEMRWMFEPYRELVGKRIV